MKKDSTDLLAMTLVRAQASMALAYVRLHERYLDEDHLDLDLLTDALMTLLDKFLTRLRDEEGLPTMS